MVKENGLSPYMSVALGADEVPEPKPSPKGLLQCLEMVKIPPENAIYVGDSPSDGHAASGAGMKSVGVTWGSHPRDSVLQAFTRCVDSVEELQGVLTAYALTGSLE